MDYPSLITSYTQSISEHVDEYVQRHGSILVGITSDTSFTRDLDGHFCRIPAYFHVLPQIVNAAQPFDLGFVSENLDSQVDYFTTRGSGFTLEAIHRFVLCITPYRPLVGSSYIPTPKFLADKKCILNVISEDGKCFVWAVLSALYKPKGHKYCVSNYLQYEHELNVQGLTFPMETKHISKFEDMNTHIAVNVLYFERQSKDFTVEYKSPHLARKHQVNLLLLDEPNTSKRHYVRVTMSCGKTRFVFRLIEHASRMIDPPPDKIVYCYGEYQQLFSKYTHVEFNRGLPSLYDFDGKQTVLLVLGDLMNEADQTMANLFTKGSHHRNVSVVFLAQNLSSKNKFARTISLNAHYMLLFKNPRDASQFAHLACQMYPNKSQFAVEAYIDAYRCYERAVQLFAD